MRSCPPIEMLIGKQFERLTVLSPTGVSESGQKLLNCLCVCGATKVVNRAALTSGNTRSCGCLKKELNRKRLIQRNTTHGLTKSPEYRIWRAMKERCAAKSKDAKNYFDRGIRFSLEWCGRGGFERFLEHVGKRPTPLLSIDRINNNGNYEPGNVRWATAKTQISNRRVKKIEQFSDEEFLEEAIRRGFVAVHKGLVV
jgi:hypothetical protein